MKVQRIPVGLGSFKRCQIAFYPRFSGRVLPGASFLGRPPKDRLCVTPRTVRVEVYAVRTEVGPDHLPKDDDVLITT